MHTSSASPGGGPSGQPGEYVGEYKGIDWTLCPWGGENSRHCLKLEGKRVEEILNFTPPILQFPWLAWGSTPGTSL